MTAAAFDWSGKIEIQSASGVRFPYSPVEVQYEDSTRTAGTVYAEYGMVDMTCRVATTGSTTTSVAKGAPPLRRVLRGSNFNDPCSRKSLADITVAAGDRAVSLQELLSDASLLTECGGGFRFMEGFSLFDAAMDTAARAGALVTGGIMLMDVADAGHDYTVNMAQYTPRQRGRGLVVITCTTQTTTVDLHLPGSNILRCRTSDGFEAKFQVAAFDQSTPEGREAAQRGFSPNSDAMIITVPVEWHEAPPPPPPVAPPRWRFGYCGMSEYESAPVMSLEQLQAAVAEVSAVPLPPSVDKTTPLEQCETTYATFSDQCERCNRLLDRLDRAIEEVDRGLRTNHILFEFSQETFDASGVTKATEAKASLVARQEELAALRGVLVKLTQQQFDLVTQYDDVLAAHGVNFINFTSIHDRVADERLCRRSKMIEYRAHLSKGEEAKTAADREEMRRAKKAQQHVAVEVRAQSTTDAPLSPLGPDQTDEPRGQPTVIEEHGVEFLEHRIIKTEARFVPRAPSNVGPLRRVPGSLVRIIHRIPVAIDQSRVPTPAIIRHIQDRVQSFHDDLSMLDIFGHCCRVQTLQAQGRVSAPTAVSLPASPHQHRVIAQGDPLCLLCCAAALEVVAVPCGHMFACEGCAQRLRAKPCIICRGHVTQLAPLADVPLEDLASGTVIAQGFIDAADHSDPTTDSTVSA